MWKYSFSAPDPSTHYLHCTFEAAIEPAPYIEVALPKWRPGRYELGHFAKNVKSFVAFDEQGRVLPSEKKDSHTWMIFTNGASIIKVQTEYFANQPDAGACRIDSNLIYVNPVHCSLYIPGQLNTPIEAFVISEEKGKLISPLTIADSNVMKAADFHEWVDSPFFYTDQFAHADYSCSEIKFNVWFAGNFLGDMAKIVNDFKAFTEVQLMMMQNFPVAEFHFMVLLLPYRFYHGVEHKACTVLALGPDYGLMQDGLYTDLMGVASHELFHVWNVKTLRPADFYIYKYDRENYSRLGWVYEGFTTYYGDLFLARSGFFSAKSYFEEINDRLKRHLENPGRYAASVAESSFDTWLDGYVPGVPQRKTSIYDEGSLVAFMLDLSIRKHSQNRFSLDDLFKYIYYDFTSSAKGYQTHDLLMAAVHFGGEESRHLLEKVISEPISYETDLHELTNVIGCWLGKEHARFFHERKLGFRIAYENTSCKVKSIWPGSPSAKVGLSIDDEIIAVNGRKVESNLHDLLQWTNGKVQLNFFRNKELTSLIIEPDGIDWFYSLRLQINSDASDEQKALFKSWCGLDFPSDYHGL